MHLLRENFLPYRSYMQNTTEHSAEYQGNFRGTFGELLGNFRGTLEELKLFLHQYINQNVKDANK